MLESADGNEQSNTTICRLDRVFRDLAGVACAIGLPCHDSDDRLRGVLDGNLFNRWFQAHQGG